VSQAEENRSFNEEIKCKLELKDKEKKAKE